MKFLVDVCAGDVITSALRRLGFNAKSMIAVDAKMLDSDILDLANTEERIVVTI